MKFMRGIKLSLGGKWPMASNTLKRIINKIMTTATLKKEDIVRIKTDQEFFKEYGSAWKSIVRPGWSASMNRLHGKVINLSKDTIINTNFSSKTYIYHGLYNIGENMLIACTEEEIAKRKAYDTKMDTIVSQLKVEEDFHKSYNGNFNHKTYTCRFTLPEYGEYCFIIHFSPTGNCQLMSIQYFNNILQNVPIEDIKMIFAHLKRRYNLKPLLQFDVRSNYLAKVHQFNPLLCNSYTSSNASPMINGILKIEELY